MISSDEAMDIYQAYVNQFDPEKPEEGAEDGHENQKGTGRSWTPYRFCSEDWLLAVTVVRSSRDRYEVALFACEDHRDFEPDAGLKAALSFILADSFHKTGKMEISFSGPRRNEAPSLRSGYCDGLPSRILRFADSLGVELGGNRAIRHEDGQRLYQAMVGLPASVAGALSAAGVDPTRAAFLLHRGTVGVETLQLLAAHSSRPRGILEGRLVPDRWLAFKRELLLMRRGLLAERVRVLFELGAENAREIFEVAWKDSGVIGISSRCPATLVLASSGQALLPAGQETKVLLCPADQTELRRLLQLGISPRQGARFLACVRDFSWLSGEEQRALVQKAKEAGMEVLRIYESLDELDAEALLRLERFATTRMDIEEQRE